MHTAYHVLFGFNISRLQTFQKSEWQKFLIHKTLIKNIIKFTDPYMQPRSSIHHDNYYKQIRSALIILVRAIFINHSIRKNSFQTVVLVHINKKCLCNFFGQTGNDPKISIYTSWTNIPIYVGIYEYKGNRESNALLFPEISLNKKIRLGDSMTAYRNIQFSKENSYLFLSTSSG